MIAGSPSTRSPLSSPDSYRILGKWVGVAGDGNLPRQFSSGKRSISCVLTRPYHRLGFCGKHDDEMMANALMVVAMSDTQRC